MHACVFMQNGHLAPTLLSSFILRLDEKRASRHTRALIAGAPPFDNAGSPFHASSAPPHHFPRHTMKTLTFSLVALAATAAALPSSSAELQPRAGTPRGPIVDLGAAGKYLGVLQNNGTVNSWKGELPCPLDRAQS